MGLQSTVYNFCFKRTSNMMITIVAGTFIFERTFDIISEGIFDNINKGRLWKDIKHKYEKNN